MQSLRTTVYGHWNKSFFGHAQLAGKVMPYTILPVHGGWMGPRVETVKLFLPGREVYVPPGKKLVLISDEKGKPLSLSDDTNLLWEEPPYLPWVAVYVADLIVGGPSDRIGADVIGIAHWPGDNWIQVYCPPEFLAALEKILPRSTRSHIVTQSANRTYHVLYMALGDLSSAQVASQVSTEISNAILLDNWS